MHSLLHKIRTCQPLIHCITNYVTANDCANLLLACGARPVMADAPEEAAEITAAAQALVLNMGTLSRSRLDAMLCAGIAANRRGIPVLLDPVGAGGSAFRREASAQLLEQIRFSAIRGNLSEMLFLAGLTPETAGVDSLTEDTAQAAVCGRTLAQKLGTTCIISGTEDIVTDGIRTFRIRNGHPVMKQITGAGCMLSALTGAFLAAENSVESCAAAVCAMGLAGSAAASRMSAPDGNASCRNYLIDAVFHMTDMQLEEGAILEAIT